MFSKQVMISTALTMALNASSANVVSDQQTTITLFSGSPSATTWVHSVIPEPTSKVITAIAPTELNNDHAAAVLRADPCDTLLAVTCTATGPGQPCAGQTGQTTIMNIGPTAFALDYATQISGTSYSVTQTCDLYIPMSKKRVIAEATSANCHKTTKALYPGGTEVDTVIWEEITQLPTATITITRNADDLPDPTATCDKQTSCEIPTNAAAPTSVPEVLKVLVPVGAALAAGVGAMI